MRLLTYFSSLKILLAAAVFILAAAGGYILYKQRPDLFRAKTELENKYPICVLGVSDPTGYLSTDKAGIRNIFINWKTSYPAARVKAIKATGAVPMITWEPYFTHIRRDELLEGIGDGKHDAYITRFAKGVGNEPLFIRFAHEPNSDWYGWSGINSGPDIYIKAFRRVRQLFLKHGNKNVRFIFSVNSVDLPDEDWNRFENYYPGDDYVDVIGLDAYNWGRGLKDWQKWRSPGKILGGSYERVVKAFPSKPIFITETASCPAGGDKTMWIDKLLGSVATRFPAVKAIVWFNFKKECDWTLSSAEMRARYYGACGKGRFECSGNSLEQIHGGKE